MLVMHVVYPDRDNECWDSPVCLTHLLASATFTMSENGWDQYDDSWRITYEPYTASHARAHARAYHDAYGDT